MVEPCYPPTFSWSVWPSIFDVIFLDSLASLAMVSRISPPHGDFQPGIGGGLWHWNGAGRVVRRQRPGAGCGSEGTVLAGRLEDGGQRLGKVGSFHVISPEIQKSRLPRLVQGDQGDGETGACDGLAFQEQDGIDSFACDTPRWHEDETWRNKEIKQVGPFKLGLEGRKHN